MVAFSPAQRGNRRRGACRSRQGRPRRTWSVVGLPGQPAAVHGLAAGMWRENGSLWRHSFGRRSRRPSASKSVTPREAIGPVNPVSGDHPDPAAVIDSDRPRRTPCAARTARAAAGPRQDKMTASCSTSDCSRLAVVAPSSTDPEPNPKARERRLSRASISSLLNFERSASRSA